MDGKIRPSQKDSWGWLSDLYFGPREKGHLVICETDSLVKAKGPKRNKSGL